MSVFFFLEQTASENTFSFDSISSSMDWNLEASSSSKRFFLSPLDIYIGIFNKTQVAGQEDIQNTDASSWHMSYTNKPKKKWEELFV